jgi:proline iminopeptidase
VHGPAAQAWAGYEAACSTLLPGRRAAGGSGGGGGGALALARLEAHYFVNRFFLPEAALLDGMPAIRDIPGAIVQGRYDVISPAVAAHELHQAWPAAELTVVPDAGHSAMEPGIRRALVAAADALRDAS